MASAMNLNVNDNGFRASKLLVDGGGYFAKQLLLQKAIQGTINTLDDFLAEKPIRQTIKKLKIKSLIRTPQSDILYPGNRSPTNLDEWDITLVTLILNDCFTLSPAEYIAVQDIRDLRNSLYGHSAKVEMTDAEFQQKWTDIASILTKHMTLLTDPKCAMFIKDLIATTATETLSADKTINTLKQWYEWGIEVEQKLEASNEDLKTSLADVDSKSKERDLETKDRLINLGNSQNIALNELSSIRQLIDEKRDQNVDRTELNRKIVQAKQTQHAFQKQLEKFDIPSDTPMTETITQRLQKNKIVVLKGMPGSGKTHIAKCALNKFQSLYPLIEPLIIREPKELEKVLDPDGSFVLLINDMIGKVSFETTECKDWSQYIETFLSHVQVGNLYVVVTIRTAIFKQCQNEEIINLFAEENVIDTDEYLLEGEKRQILELYRKYHNIDISDDQADQIVKQQYAGIGFPLLCKIMQGHDVDELFKRPTKYLKTMISPSQSKDPTLFVALFMTLVGNNMLCKNELTKDQIECFQALQIFFKSTNMDMYTVYQAADKFEGTLLTLNENENRFAFIHEAVAHSTFVVALELKPDILLECCPFDSLVENMNLICQTKNAKSNTINPYIMHKQRIINRMKQVMSTEGSTNTNIEDVTNATIWKERSFTNDALRMFDNEHFRIKDEKGMCMACHFAKCGQKYPLEVVVGRIQRADRNKSVEQLQKALAEACLSAEYECVDYLIAKVEMSQEVVIAAVKGGKIEIIQQIISKYGKDKVNTLRENNTKKTLLHIAARNGKIDLIQHLYQICPTNFDKIDGKGCNVAHSSAECINKGAIDSLDFFINLGINPKDKNNEGQSILHRAVIAGNIDTVKHICIKYPDLLLGKDKNGKNALHNAARRGPIECIKYLVDQGADPGVKTKNEATILHRSAVGVNIATMKYIHETYPDMLYATDIYGNNVLHYAARYGTVECMKYLVDQGADPGKKNKNEETILHRSAVGVNIATMKYIHETYPDMLYATDIYVNNVLHYAARYGTVECMKYLVDQGADPGVKTKTEELILHRSAVGGNIATMKYIHETYPDMLYATDIYGNNVLHDAASNGTVECLKYLVDQGVDPGVKTKDEETILHRSAVGGNIATMKYIHETYPDMLYATDINGNTALQDAARYGTVEWLKYLVDQGADPDVKTKNEETILHRSALGGKIATMKYIHETYPDMLYATDINGNTALQDAARYGTVKCLKYLVDQGADPDVKTKNEETILHISAFGENIATMKYIHETYPNMLNATNIYGNTALQDAARYGTVECLKYLVDQGADPDVKTKNEETILHRSALGGKIATMKYIHETYPDMLYATDINGNTALQDAARYGTVECLKYLVDQGADPDVKTKNEETILHRSALGGKIATMKYIHETYPDMLYATDINGNTALQDAARYGTVECLKYLVDQGADPDVKTKNEETILHRSALGGKIATMKYIHETYPDMLYATDINGNTALQDAARYGTVECLKYLVDQGADPDVKTKNEETILHRSALGGKIETMKYIHETYPDMLYATDINGNTALQDAARYGTVECLKYLVDQGADPDVKTKNEETILHRSALGGKIATMKYIHETYPDMLYVTDIFGNTALHDAASNGTVECMKYLVNQGADPGVKTKDEETILHRSAVGGNIATIKYIHETFPDMLYLRDIYGNTALHHAARYGTVECMKYLVDQGAEPGVKTEDGTTILHLSAMGRNIATMKYIHETCPYMLYATDINGNTALQDAARYGTVDCLQFLLCQGIDPLSKNDKDENILHIALTSEHTEIAKFIIITCKKLLNTIDNEVMQDLLTVSIENSNTNMIDLCVRILSQNNDEL